jgi:hypothetical protein
LQARNVNGFTAAEVDDALRGAVVGQVKLIPRFEIRDSENQLLRATTNVLSGEVRHRSQDQIKQTLSCLVREANIPAEDYPDVIIEDGPLFFLRLGEASGATAFDSSTFGRNFTYNGTVGYSHASLLNSDPDDKAITFDGSTAYASIPDAAWMDVSQLSLEAWIQTSYVGGNTIVMSRHNGAANFWFLGVSTTTGYLRAAVYIGTVLKSFVTTANVADGREHHVVFTYDGAHAKLYVDSVRVLKTAQTGSVDTGTSAIRIGATVAGTEFFNGQIDEAAMYPRALSSAEVREHYAQGSGDLAEIDYTRDRLKIFVKIRMNRNGDDGTPWTEFPMGLYLLSAPDRDMSATGISRQVQGFDQTTVLLQSAVTTRYVILETVNYITAVTTLLTAAGLDVTDYQLTPTTLTLPATRSWPLGTTRLEIVNDLLASINYRRFRFNSDGVGIAEPDVLPKSRAVDYSYSTDEFSVMTPDMRYTQNLFDVPNVVVLSNTQPKRNTITSTAINNLLSSPTSVLRREGRKVYYVDDGFDAADQTTLDAAANNLLTRLSQPSEVWQFGTLAHPFHEDEDILTLTDNSGLYNFGISGQNYMELEWSLPFSDLAAGTMTHVAQRIVPVV